LSTIARKPEHSPLGASSAERWMNCTGSQVLIRLLALPPSDDTDFAKEGTAAHECAAHCLTNECDTWETIGMTFKGVVVDKEMADAVQLYLQTIRELLAEHIAGAEFPSHVQHLIEEKVSDSSISDDFYGTADDVIDGPAILDITDLKYGVGIAVDAIDNPQLKYYAVGVLAKRIGARRVRLRIVQPRAFHPDGPIREWETTAEELLKWRDEVLKPAMLKAQTDKLLTPGEWCRFCPAKVACPMLAGLFLALTQTNTATVAQMTDEQLGMNYELLEAAMIGKRAYEEETFKRLSRGATVPGAKLVPKRSNRVFVGNIPRMVDGVEVSVPIKTLLIERFGDDAMTKPEQKSPAEIDALGPKGKSFTKEFAYSPKTGLTVAPDHDKRVSVAVDSAASAFAHYTGPDAS